MARKRVSRAKSTEFFCLDAAGNKQDADLHDTILSAVDPTAEIAAVRAGLLADGWTLAQVDSLWPLPSKTAAARQADDDGP